MRQITEEYKEQQKERRGYLCLSSIVRSLLHKQKSGFDKGPFVKSPGRQRERESEREDNVFGGYFGSSMIWC